MSPVATRRDVRRRAGLLLAVAGMHVAALWTLQRLGVWKDRRVDVDAPLLQVMLLPQPEQVPLAPPPRRQPLAPGQAPRPVPAAREGFVAPLPAQTDPMPGPTGPTGPTATPPPQPPSPLPTAPPPLVLDLPRAASAPRRSPALDDPRTNTARATVESRIAAMLDDRLIEEQRGDSGVRFRKGSECVDVLPNRDAQLDPFNESFARKPGTARPC